MIHLLIAHDFDADMPPRFYLGVLRPTYEQREEKDKTHFNRTRGEKNDALAVSPIRLIERRVFLGTVLHLYADYYWDIGRSATT